MSNLAFGQTSNGNDIEVNIRPRFCTLAQEETVCHAEIEVEWQSEQLESLCLEILEHAEIKQCWQRHKHGSYRFELSFSEDLLILLRDTVSRKYLAERTLAIVREAVRYRRKRRQPWNIFY